MDLYIGLAPEFKFPTAAVDCIESYRSVVEDYEIDPRKIIIGMRYVYPTVSPEHAYL